MNEQNELESCKSEVKELVEIPDQDDRFPGSFLEYQAHRHWATPVGA